MSFACTVALWLKASVSFVSVPGEDFPGFGQLSKVLLMLEAFFFWIILCQMLMTCRICSFCLTVPMIE